MQENVDYNFPTAHGARQTGGTKQHISTAGGLTDAAKETSHEMLHSVASQDSKYNFISFLITFPFQMKYFLFYGINVITISSGRV